MKDAIAAGVARLGKSARTDLNVRDTLKRFAGGPGVDGELERGLSGVHTLHTSPLRSALNSI